ncbi:MAG: hypothetical protein ACE5RN_07405 [Nitrosopumilaceae archaeon]
MQSLLDPNGSYIKSEKNVKKYLSSISDDQIKVFYENIELTSFPILLAKEYHKRFSKSKRKPNQRKSFRHGDGVKISKLKQR